MIRNVIATSLIVTFTVTSYASGERNSFSTKKDFHIRQSKTSSMKKNIVNRVGDNNRYHKNKYHKNLTQTYQTNQPDRANHCPETMTTSELATILDNMLLGKPNTNN
jgi:hypothetical protein